MDANPYQPPGTEAMAEPEVLPAQKAPRVMGVLSLSLACLGLVLAIYMGVRRHEYRNPIAWASIWASQDSEQGRQARANVALARINRAISATVGLLALALVPIGIGQIRCRRWAGVASVWWGGIGIVAVGAGVYYAIAVVVPLVVKANAWAAGGWFLSAWTGGLLSAAFVPLPLAQLICFTRQSVKLAMVR